MNGYQGTCERVMARLSDYLDEELDAGTAAEVERHLRQCGACLVYAESLRRTIELCRGYQPGVKPRPLTRSAHAELENAWEKALAGRRQNSNRGNA